MPRTSLATSLSLLVALAGCTARNPDARLDFAAAPRDMTVTPRDLVPAPPSGDLAPSGVQLTNGGLLESVASDRSRAAFLALPAAQGHTTVGQLQVMTLPYGAPRTLADDVFGATFAGAGTLFYSFAPAASTDGGSSSVYGGLGLWTPGWTGGVTLSSGYAVTRLLTSGYAMWWNAAAPSTAGSGDLVLARVSDCSASGCAPITLAGAVHLVALAGGASAAAYSIKNGGGYDVWLVDIGAGTTNNVVSGGSSGAISLSSDGSLLACIGAGGSLKLFATADGSSVSWGALPAGARAESVVFADAATLVVRALPSGGTHTSAWVTTAAAARLVAADASAISVVRSGAGGTTRWLFVAGTPDAHQLVDVGAYDLSAATPARIAVAQATSLGFVALGADQKRALAISGWDASAASGKLQTVSLPDGAVTPLDDGVSPNDVSFAASSTVVWIAADHTLHGWHDGAGTVYAGGVSDFRLRGASTLYFTVGAADAIHGYAPGIWFTSLQ